MPEGEREQALRLDIIPRRELAVIGVAVFVTAFGHTAPGALANLPFKFVLKDRLLVGASGMAAFFAVTGLPWYFKPLVAVGIEAAPLLGSRRRHYVIGAALAATAAWLLIALLPAGYDRMLAATLLLETALVVVSTVLGGLLVDTGQRYGVTGRLASWRVGLVNVGALIAAPLGGLLAKYALGWTAAVEIALLLALLAVAWRWLAEPRTAVGGGLARARDQLAAVFRARSLLGAAALGFLVMTSPGFGTPLFYFQTHELGFDSTFVGTTRLVSAAASIGAALLYSVTCKRITLRRSLAIGIALHAVGALTFIGYRSPSSALVITGVYACCLTMGILPLWDLAVRATPRGVDALGYSVMMSAVNLGSAVSDTSGAWLYDKFHLSFHDLVWVNAGTSLVALLAVPYLPGALVASRERSESAVPP